MCSKCFREAQRVEQQKPAEQKDDATKDASKAHTPVAAAAAASSPQPIPAVSKASPAALASPAAAPAAAEAAPAAAASPAEPKAPTRCQKCRKKVGLTGFKCKCGQLFCGQHRYAEAHDCGFDYKSMQREKLAAANPVVQAAKVERI